MKISRPPARYRRRTCHGRVRSGQARVLPPSDEAERVPSLVFDKYAAGKHGDLTGWRERALLVAIDLAAP